MLSNVSGVATLAFDELIEEEGEEEEEAAAVETFVISKLLDWAAGIDDESVAPPNNVVGVVVVVVVVVVVGVVVGVVVEVVVEVGVGIDGSSDSTMLYGVIDPVTEDGRLN